MNINVVGLDIAKNIFHFYSLGEDGKATKKKLKRAELLRFLANYTVSLIGMEACGGAHYWARELIKLGHEIVLLNARYVKSFVVGYLPQCFTDITQTGENITDFLRKKPYSVEINH